ncbi:hypothetical protein Tco_0792173 [Tanacetum coccineum]
MITTRSHIWEGKEAARNFTDDPQLFGPFPLRDALTHGPSDAGCGDDDLLMRTMLSMELAGIAAEAPLPRKPRVYVDPQPEFLEPHYLGPQPRPVNYLSLRNFENVISIEDTPTHGGLPMRKSPGSPEDSSTPTADDCW